MIEGGGEKQATGVSAAAPRVFISYASADKAIANSLCVALETAGIRCWIAPRDVAPGALYADAIVRAITSCASLVLLLSKNAIASSHVGKEVERASSKKRPIIAMRLDSAALTPALEYFLSESQWIDSPVDRDSAHRQLIDAIRDMLSSTSSGPGLIVNDVAPGPPMGRRNRKLIIACLSVGLFCVMAGLASTFWVRRQAPTSVQNVADNTISGKSIAVLPFTDLSRNHDQEYFADGIAEEILDRLAKVQGLKVAGHASSMQFKGTTKVPKTIASILGVTYLVEGSVTKEANRLKVSAQLSNPRTGSQIWSDRFDSDLPDSLHVQDTIAAEIARALQISVEVDNGGTSAARSLPAHDAYLSGLHSANRLTRDGAESAVALFQRALALDPSYAPAAVALARTYAYIGEAGWAVPKISFEQAREAALLAERLDPHDPQPHIILADVYIHYDWNWSGAAEELGTAFTLGPRERNGVQMSATLASAIGDMDEARRLYLEALVLDPLDAAAYGGLGFEVHMRAGRYRDAEQAIRRALEIAPGWASGQYFLGEALMLQGRYEEAIAEFKKETIDDGQFEGSAMVLSATGRNNDSDAMLASAIAQDGSSWPSEIARVYSYRGDKAHAFEWLEKAYEQHDEDLYFMKGDPLFKNLESDPRYKEFLRKINLTEKA